MAAYCHSIYRALPTLQGRAGVPHTHARIRTFHYRDPPSPYCRRAFPDGPPCTQRRRRQARLDIVYVPCIVYRTSRIESHIEYRTPAAAGDRSRPPSTAGFDAFVPPVSNNTQNSLDAVLAATKALGLFCTESLDDLDVDDDGNDGLLFNEDPFALRPTGGLVSS